MCQYFKHQKPEAPTRDPVHKLRRRGCAFVQWGVYNSRARCPTRPEEVAGMFLKQIFSTGRIMSGCAGVCALLALTASGCSLLSHGPRETNTTSASTPPADATESAAGP